jgi:Tol biopolymer transport system component
MDGSFSPDGTQFVFTSGRSGNADLWVMNASEITPSVPCPERPPSDPYPLVIRQLTSWPDTSFISDAAGINYDGSRVAIESGAPLTGGSPPPGGGDDVFGVYGDGTGMRRLTYGARGTAVMMSGNGEMIVYHGRGNITGQNADGSDEVFVVSFDGTIMRQLTFNPISLYECPGTRISHDGQWVAFRSNADLTGENADHNYEAFVVRSDGTGLKQLSNEPNAAYSVWGIMLSRDGQKVAFGSTSDFLGTNTDHSREVFIINRDGTGLAQVTDNPDPVTYFDIGYGITWAGDTLLIYGTADPTGQNPDGHSQMFMVNSDGTNLRQLTCDPYFDSTMGMLSYDGTIVTFRSRADFTGQNPDHSNEVFMIRSDGTRLTQVSRFDGPGSGSCLDRPSGDGRHIAFTSNGNQTGQNPDLGSEGFIADIANTPAGNNVEVEPGAAVEMTFGEVTSPGNTTASASTTPPAEPPSGFSLLGNYYDISTTATYAGPITVSIPYDPAAVPPGHEGELRLFHWDAIANQWQDVTTGVDTVNHRVIGAVTSLSWLAVGFPLYQWQGFLPPVDNPPVFNAAKAGRTIPVKWQLKDANGAFVSSLSVVVYNPLRYRQIGDDGAPVDPLPTDATIAGAAGLRYDSAAKQFIFNWKTSSAFAGKCYELLLDLDDGTQKAARFKFTR